MLFVKEGVMHLFECAPRFALSAASGLPVSSHDLGGVYGILCFFPRAGTRDWFKELEAFTEILPEIERLDARVLGISPDPPAVLSQFADRGTPYPTLLSDPDQEAAKAYGVLTPAGEVRRATFLIDRAGAVRWVWPEVTAAGHTEEVLATLRSLHAADVQVSPHILARRAYRALSDAPVSRGALERLVEAAHLSPSCFNNQPWRFVVATGHALDRVKGALPGANYWAQRAPVILALVSRRDLDCVLSDHRDYFLYGCGMATGMLMVQATQMGLVAHPIAGYDPIKVKQALDIPSEYVLISLIVVGKRGDAALLSDRHRALELGPRDRKPLPAVLMYDRFSQPKATEDRP